MVILLLGKYTSVDHSLQIRSLLLVCVNIGKLSALKLINKKVHFRRFCAFANLLHVCDCNCTVYCKLKKKPESQRGATTSTHNNGRSRD